MDSGSNLGKRYVKLTLSQVKEQSYSLEYNVRCVYIIIFIDEDCVTLYLSFTAGDQYQIFALNPVMSPARH